MTDHRIAALVARFGWRISSLDARRAGVPESALFDAACRGEARIERTHITSVSTDGRCSDVSIYLVFA